MHTASKHSLAPGITLTYVKTDKLKTGCLSVNIISGLHHETVARNALLPRVLRRGSREHPDMASLAAALDELYGARIEPVLRKKGELHCLGFYADFLDDRYIADESYVLEKTFDLLGGILLSPDMPDGMLRSDYIESEKSNLIDDIQAAINDKRTYVVDRLLKEMCSKEAFGLNRLGDEDGVSKITPEALTAHHRSILSDSRIEIFYCGFADQSRIMNALGKASAGLPARGSISSPKTDVVLYPESAQPKQLSEPLDISQGKLAVGFRLGRAMQGIPDFPALMVFNSLYGGCATSKLFLNMREKLSLCYYANSMLDRNKGIMIVSSGIDFSNYDPALNEITLQLENVKKGDIQEWELLSAKRAITTAVKSAMDRPGGLEDLYFSSIVSSHPYDPETLCSMIESVTLSRIMEAAAEITPDTIYFLKGNNI